MQQVAFFVGATAADVALNNVPFSLGTALSLNGPLGAAVGGFVGAIVGVQIVVKDPSVNPMVPLFVMIGGGIVVPMVAGASLSTAIAMSVAGGLLSTLVTGA